MTDREYDAWRDYQDVLNDLKEQMSEEEWEAYCDHMGIDYDEA